MALMGMTIDRKTMSSKTKADRQDQSKRNGRVGAHHAVEVQVFGRQSAYQHGGRNAAERRRYVVLPQPFHHAVSRAAARRAGHRYEEQGEALHPRWPAV